MKILQLCIRVPYPPSDGATIAMYNISKSFYENGSQLKILAFNTNKNFVPGEKISEEFRKHTGIETVEIDLSIKLLPAFLNLFTKKSFNISRFFSEKFNDRLKKILADGSYDIVHLEGLYVTPYIETIRKFSNAKIVLRSHNVEYIIWERLAASVKNSVKKKYLKFLAKRLKKYETGLLNKYDAIVPITSVDQNIFQSLGCNIPIRTSPLGVDVNEYPFEKKMPAEFSVFHLGSMDWMPNLEAVDWFLNHVYEKLTRQLPGIKICLAGKDMPGRIKEMAGRNLIVMDRIEDSKGFMKDKSVMIVPLLSGGGMRVKIIEGMASGKAIVSTTIGAEGINYTNNKNILIADTPDDFVAAIIKFKKDKEYCKSTGENARKLVENEYDNKVIGKELLNFYKKLILKPGA
ncbi:MAG TPA: glycosyltransferase family 4 protein [Bacteroidia bacterium]|nr:glycosyltransferase family 4 protein [Bacteroidia bacterium]